MASLSMSAQGSKGKGPEAMRVRRTVPSDVVATAYFKDEIFSSGVQLQSAHTSVVQLVGDGRDFHVVFGPYPAGSGAGTGDFELSSPAGFDLATGYAALRGVLPRVVTTRIATGAMGVSVPGQTPALAVWVDLAGQREVVVKIGVSGTTTTDIEVAANAGTSKSVVSDDQFVVATGPASGATVSAAAPVPPQGPERDFYEFAKARLREAGLYPR
jgi:hypothetical protein